MLIATACGDDGGGDEGRRRRRKTTITWWHNSNNEPGKGFYEQAAKDFEADHPGVTIEISAMAHEDMVDKLDAAFQSGDVPDIYMERGGGELADHVEAGSSGTSRRMPPTRSTRSVARWPAGRWTARRTRCRSPWESSAFWYNKGSARAGRRDRAPTTMDELYDVIGKLKAADLTPLSVGAGDKWPAAHYWYYTAMRACAEDVLKDAVNSLDFSDPCFVQGRRGGRGAVGDRAVQPGFLTTPAQEGATSASGLLATGKVAMEMQGHWEPGVMQGLTDDGKGLGDKTGWFPFPAVDGGAGDPAAQLGGGDAWAVSEGAPDEAVEFIKYLLSDEVQTGFAENDMGLPTNPAATGSVSDPALAELLEVRDAAPYVQLYFDTAFGASVGGAMNDEIALLFADKASPQDVVKATQAAADQEQ